jgi:hypothetical protein
LTCPVSGPAFTRGSRFYKYIKIRALHIQTHHFLELS